MWLTWLWQVFMKETFEIHLDSEAAAIQQEAAILIQTRTRAFLARNKFLRTRAASSTIQRMSRMWKARYDEYSVSVCVCVFVCVRQSVCVCARTRMCV